MQRTEVHSKSNENIFKKNLNRKCPPVEKQNANSDTGKINDPQIRRKEHASYCNQNTIESVKRETLSGKEREVHQNNTRLSDENFKANGD